MGRSTRAYFVADRIEPHPRRGPARPHKRRKTPKEDDGDSTEVVAAVQVTMDHEEMELAAPEVARALDEAVPSDEEDGAEEEQEIGVDDDDDDEPEEGGEAGEDAEVQDAEADEDTAAVDMDDAGEAFSGEEDDEDEGEETFAGARSLHEPEDKPKKTGSVLRNIKVYYFT